MNAERFWKIVKKEVERQNTSYEYLYRKTGISKGTFSAWKSRRIMPRAGDACRIAAALGVSLEYLLTGAEASERPSNPRAQEITALLPLLGERDLAAVKALVSALSEGRGEKDRQEFKKRRTGGRKNATSTAETPPGDSSSDSPYPS